MLYTGILQFSRIWTLRKDIPLRYARRSIFQIITFIYETNYLFFIAYFELKFYQFSSYRAHKRANFFFLLQIELGAYRSILQIITLRSSKENLTSFCQIACHFLGFRVVNIARSPQKYTSKKYLHFYETDYFYGAYFQLKSYQFLSHRARQRHTCTKFFGLLARDYFGPTFVVQKRKFQPILSSRCESHII